MLLSYLQSTQSYSFPFFFSTNSSRLAANDVDSRINPFLRLILIYSFNIANSLSDSQQISLKLGLFPSLIGILQSYSQCFRSASVLGPSRNRNLYSLYSASIRFSEEAQARSLGLGIVAYTYCRLGDLLSLVGILQSLLQPYQSMIIYLPYQSMRRLYSRN